MLSPPRAGVDEVSGALGQPLPLPGEGVYIFFKASLRYFKIITLMSHVDFITVLGAVEVWRAIYCTILFVTLKQDSLSL